MKYSTRSNSKLRRGQSLLILILLMIVLIGIMALVLDFGFVLFSRRTMQTAVNTSALEGARDNNAQGRDDASTVTRNVFDDDLDPGTNDTTLGAGPDQSLVQRDVNDQPILGTGAGAQNLLAGRSQYVYRPAPELNEANAIHGDLVAGTYEGAALSAEHIEGDDYTRDDFTVGNGGAFLSRLRRTPERADVANPLDRVPGISSSGSGSPLLIGHLAWFKRNALGTYDIRRDGVTIRATAIADLTPVTTVFQPPTGVFGTSQFYSITTSAKRVRFDETTNEIIPLEPGDAEWNSFDLDGTYATEPARLAIGLTLESVSPLPAEPAITSGYVSVIDQNDRIVGFLLKEATPELQRNASPRLHDAWIVLDGLDSSIRAAILARHRELSETLDPEAALRPVLVRTLP